MGIAVEGREKFAFCTPIRVYYEDTDAGGVVYYANYLRFFERARTEWLRALGCEQSALLRETGVAFVARSAQLEYLKPAKLDDELNILSKIESVGRAQVIFAQRAECRGEVIVEARMRIASLDPLKGKAVAMPREVYEQFKALL
jgi:acyl-CoA thioester hydrolase